MGGAYFTMIKCDLNILKWIISMYLWTTKHLSNLIGRCLREKGANICQRFFVIN